MNKAQHNLAGYRLFGRLFNLIDRKRASYIGGTAFDSHRGAYTIVESCAVLFTDYYLVQRR